MHASIEKARKAAGISSLRRNYPEGHDERGIGQWAAFIGVISDELAVEAKERQREGGRKGGSKLEVNSPQPTADRPRDEAVRSF